MPAMAAFQRATPRLIATAIAATTLAATTAAAPAVAAPPHSGAPGVCHAPWFHGGARAQLEADGEMPMSITMSIRDPAQTSDGCSAGIDIHSKSALAAMMGPPVVMEQVHRLAFLGGTAGHPGERVSSQRATINAKARYARLFGEASFDGKGPLAYASQDIREGAVLAGESLTARTSLNIHSLSSDEAVTTIRADEVTVTIGPRHVGPRQWIETALGRQECMPITYERRASLGALHIGDDVERPEPYVMEVTDWYCPAESFVLRTDVKQGDRIQRIDTTAIGLPDTAP